MKGLFGWSVKVKNCAMNYISSDQDLICKTIIFVKYFIICHIGWS